MIFEFIFRVLINDNKSEVIVVENVEKMNQDDIRDFIRMRGKEKG